MQTFVSKIVPAIV